MRPRGFALLITLWLLVPLSLLLLVLSGTARSDAQVAAGERDDAVLAAAAAGGLETAIVALVGDRESDPPGRIDIGGVAVTILSEPLAGLINPNLASGPLLRALFSHAGVGPAAAEALAGAILEWRTPGQQQAGGLGKAALYHAAGRDYGPPGEPFETIDELGDVLGMTPAILARIRPALSLFTDAPPVAALAPPLVRSALAELGGTRSGSVTRGTIFHLSAAAARRGSQLRLEAVVRIGPGLRPWRILAWTRE